MTNYHDYHETNNPGQPWYMPEFQGGAFDPWGGPGYEACGVLTGPDFQDVFYKHNWAANAKLLSYYMVYGYASLSSLPLSSTNVLAEARAGLHSRSLGYTPVTTTAPPSTRHAGSLRSSMSSSDRASSCARPRSSARRTGSETRRPVPQVSPSATAPHSRRSSRTPTPAPASLSRASWTRRRRKCLNSRARCSPNTRTTARASRSTSPSPPPRARSRSPRRRAASRSTAGRAR